MLLISLAVTASVALSWPVSSQGPSGSYVPIHTTCPSNHTYIRPASAGLNIKEAAWRQVRVKQVIPALESYLQQNPIPEFDVTGYISDLWANTTMAPVLAMTFSGGGWRSAYPGLGLYQALDGRNEDSVKAGTGGLFQAMTYQAGLSGGTLATTPLAIFGYPVLSDLIQNTNLNGSTNQTSYDEILAKKKAGFNITAADFLGATAVPNTLLNSAGVDPMSYTWSGIQVQESFINGSHPMPVVVTTEVVPSGPNKSPSYNATGPFYNGTILIPSNENIVVVEFTPFEYGSWVGRIPAFADIQYMGTQLNNSMPVDDTDCVEGFDTAVFIMGSASDSLSAWTATEESNGVVGQFVKRGENMEQRTLPGENYRPYPPEYGTVVGKYQVEEVLGPVSELPKLNKLFNETAQNYFYGKIANPFFGWSGVHPEAGLQQELWLVDGGEGQQESPWFPMIQPARGVDFIIASDACGSELPNGWMNGTNLLSTARLAAAAGLPFPTVPKSVNTMLNLGYTSQPVFFGCNDASHIPLILYAADYPYSAYTNISSLSNKGRSPIQAANLTANTLPLISQSGFRDNWNECLACGAVYRSLRRLGRDLPDRCKQCMSAYCWNGTEVDTQPLFLDPSLALNPTLDWSEWNATVFG